MIKFIIKSIFLTLLVVFTLGYTDDKFQLKLPYYDTWRDYKDMDAIGIGIFGSSHAYTSYNTWLFEKELRVPTYNFGGPGQRLTITEPAIKEVLEKHELDLGIVDIFSVSLSEKDTENYNNQQLLNLDYIPFSFSKLSKSIDLYGWQEFLYASSETVRYHNQWNKIDLFKERNVIVTKNVDTYNGYRAPLESFGQKIWDDFIKKYGTDSINPEIKALTQLQKMRIDAIINEFEEKQVPLIFVSAPSFMYDYAPNYAAYGRAIETYLAKRNIPYIEFNLLRDDLGLDDTYFSDPNHVNAKGAELVTEYMISYIEQHYDIDQKIKIEDLKLNRYYALDNGFKSSFQNNFKFPTEVHEKNGLTDVHVYKKANKEFHVLLEVDTLHFIPQQIMVRYWENRNTEKERQRWATKDFHPEEIMIYKDNSYVLFPVFTEENQISDVTVYIKKPKYQKLFYNKQLTLQ